MKLASCYLVLVGLLTLSGCEYTTSLCTDHIESVPNLQGVFQNKEDPDKPLVFTSLESGQYLMTGWGPGSPKVVRTCKVENGGQLYWIGEYKPEPSSDSLTGFLIDVPSEKKLVLQLFTFAESEINAKGLQDKISKGPNGSMILDNSQITPIDFLSLLSKTAVSPVSGQEISVLFEWDRIQNP